MAVPVKEVAIPPKTAAAGQAAPFHYSRRGGKYLLEKQHQASTFINKYCKYCETTGDIFTNTGQNVISTLHLCRIIVK